MIIELLKNICEQFEEKKIEYMLSGSIAMSIYAVPRFTRDVDIVINLKKEEAEKFISIFSDKFYLNQKTVIEETVKKGMFNVIDQTSGYKIDFIVKKNNEFRDEEFKRRRYEKIFDFHAWIVSPEDLILSKLIWIQKSQSDTQINDIRSLLRNTSIDKNYILAWCKKLKIFTFNLI